MPKKLIHYNPMHAGALHCDVPSCGHNLEPRPFTAELIGTPCPKCGSDMLTQRDYDDTLKVFRRIDWINKWFGWLGTDSPDDPKNITVAVKCHDGNLEVERHQ